MLNIIRVHGNGEARSILSHANLFGRKGGCRHARRIGSFLDIAADPSGEGYRGMNKPLDDFDGSCANLTRDGDWPRNRRH